MKPPKNSCFLLYAIKQYSTLLKFPFSKLTTELSLDAIPIFELVTFIKFELRIDFSPTDNDLSPQKSKFEFNNLYSPYEKSAQSFCDFFMFKLLITTFEKSASKASLNEFSILIFETVPFVFIKFKPSSQFEL